MPVPILTKIKLDSSELEAGATRAKAKLVGMKNAASSLGGALGLAFGGSVLLSSMRKISEEFDRVGKLATRFATSVESIQRLDFAASLAGTDIEQIAAAMVKAGVSAKTAADGSQTMADAFQNLGINAARFESLTPEEKIIELSRALEKAGGSASAVNDILTIVGTRTGVELIPLLRQGADELENVFSSAKVATEEQVREIEKLNDAITTWKNQLTPFKLAAVATFTAIAEQIRVVAALIANIVAKRQILDEAGTRFIQDPFNLKNFKTIVDEILKGFETVDTVTGEEIEAIREKPVGGKRKGGPIPEGSESPPSGADIQRGVDAAQPEEYGPPRPISGAELQKGVDTMQPEQYGPPLPPPDGEAARKKAFEETLEAIREAITLAKGTLAGLSPGSVISSSLASIGGGGGVAEFANPQIKIMEEHVRLLQKQLTVLKEIEGKRTKTPMQ